VGRKWDPVSVWQRYTTAEVTGKAMPTGHFIPEEDPNGTIAELLDFFTRHPEP